MYCGVNNLNNEIKSRFYCQKYNCVQKSIISGNTKSLWKAVKIAKNTNISDIPKVMYNDWIKFEKENIPCTFADFFKLKVKNIVDTTQIDQKV